VRQILIFTEPDADEIDEKRVRRVGERRSSESPEATDAMETFTPTLAEAEQRAQILFRPRFSDENWAEFEEYFRPELGRGILSWELDLRQMTFVNSMLLGLLLNMHSEVSAAGGRVCLVVETKSMINQLLTLSKLRQIVTVKTV
jgi:anti-anti-sigma factor